MRFRQLDFSTFGPFTDFRLDFDPSCGLQVIYGPNESGKSSALRAVRGLLYGIPGDGRDEFLHPGDSLRLQAIIEHSDGHCLTFGRRKGRGKKTLLDELGKALPSDLLDGYLGGVDELLFGRLYGLDHGTLVLGGQALLQEGGRVGESLFAAGLGTGVRRVRDTLKSEAGELYKPKARTLVVDKAIDQFHEAQRRAAELSVSAESWRKLSLELEQESERAVRLDAEIRALETEKQRLTRYLDAHQPLSDREHLLNEVQALGDLPALPLDFSERRQRIQMARSTQRTALSKATEKVAGLKVQLKALPEDARLLALAPLIDRLHRGLDAAADAQTGRPITEAKLAGIRAHLQDKAADLGLAHRQGVFSSLPDALVRTQARRLAERYRRMVDDRESLQSKRAILDGRRTGLESRLLALGEVRDTAQLEESLRQLRMALGLDTEIVAHERALTTQRTALQGALRALPSWTGELDDLRYLMVPSAQTVQTFESRYDESAEALRQTKRDLAETERRGKRTRDELARLGEGGQVRSRQDLRQSRVQRDEAWQALLTDWREGASATDARQAQDRFEHAVRETDDLSDKLLDSASQLAKIERMSEEIASTREQWTELQKQKKDQEVEQQQLQGEWSALWSSPHLNPETPSKMRDWLARRESLLALAAEVDAVIESLETAQGRRQQLLRDQAPIWDGLLGSTGSRVTVGEAIEGCERALAPLKTTADERRQLTADLAQIDLALSELEAALLGSEQTLKAWRSEWAEVAIAFGREPSVDPQALEALLDRYEELRRMLDESERSEAQLQVQVAQIASFEAQVRELAGDLEEALTPETDLAVFVQRQVMGLDEQRRVQIVRHQLTEQLRSLESEVEESQSSLERSQLELGELLRAAGASELEQLPELETKVARAHEVRERLADLEAALRPLTGGQSMDEFAQGLKGLDWDAVPGQIRELERRLSEREQQRSQAWQRQGQLEQELRGCDGVEAASLAAQEAAEAMAEGKAAVARYVRLSLSEAVLKREMERYRQENEGPVLKAASTWFAELTCGAYAGLTTGSDPKTDEPRLEAVTAAGRQVAVEGLSDGTRDQLFLALRLATIAQTLESTEPVPMILDDVLVHFDSARAQATLKVLAQFAQRTQILLFTHLERDRELALALPRDQAAVLGLQALAF